MKLSPYLVILAFCAAAAWAQDSTPAKSAPVVAITDEPSHHQKLDNEYIRVFAVDVAPHKSTLMHHHDKDYVSVAFGHTQIDSVTPDGMVKHVTLEDGDVRYTPAGLTHVATNQASTPFRNATIELMQNNGRPVCVNKCDEDPRAKDWPPLAPGEKLIGYGDSFRIVAGTIQPKQTISNEEPFPHLAIMLTDFHGRVGPEGSGGTDFTQKAADLMFHGGHANHGLTNVGDQDVRIMVIEFKPVKNDAAKE